tara:strand:+ start:406 stop:636 length:231 start_codon:yes stop_codon:yes gene_type:complete
MERDKAKDFIKFQHKRKTINLCKAFLFLIEDAKDKGDPLTSDSYQKIRKRVLDFGNDAIREFEETMDGFNINFNKD